MGRHIWQSHGVSGIHIYIYTKTESAVGDRLGTSQDSTKCGALKARLWAQELIKTQVKHARHTDSL